MSYTHYRAHSVTSQTHTRHSNDLKKKKENKLTNPQISSAREVFPILVERDSHDSVGGVEGLLHSITVVDVNVYV